MGKKENKAQWEPMEGGRRLESPCGLVMLIPLFHFTHPKAISLEAEEGREA